MGTKYTYSEGTTYQSESTPITIAKIPTGEYKIKAVSGKLEGEYSYTATPGTQEITVTVAEPVYSIIYDKSLASDPAGCLTYAGACTGFTPMTGGSGNANEGSWAEGNGTLFDAIKVGYLNGSTFTEYPKSSVYGNIIDDEFTRIPKIYQKVTDISEAGDGSKVQLDISLKPFSGATLHPAFIMDGVELTYKDIGRYLGYVNSPELRSLASKSPTASTTRANFRASAKANGSNYGLLSYYDWDLVNKLILFAFKTFNTQGALGLGYTSSSSKRDTGGTRNKSWMYGTSGGTTQVAVLGIEDWWGNLYQWIDNYFANSSYIYASNTASPSDSTSNMTAICANPASVIDGVNPLTCRAGLNDFFIGETSGGAANSTGMCDYQKFGADSRVAFVGGGWNHGTGAGAFCFYSNDSLSYTGSTVGARLVHWG